jgi:hypothetical protein
MRFFVQQVVCSWLVGNPYPWDYFRVAGDSPRMGIERDLTRSKPFLDAGVVICSRDAEATSFLQDFPKLVLVLMI